MMNKPDLSMCATPEDYYKQIARYYQKMSSFNQRLYNEQTMRYNACLARLVELDEIGEYSELSADEGVYYWRSSGEIV